MFLSWPSLGVPLNVLGVLVLSIHHCTVQLTLVSHGTKVMYTPSYTVGTYTLGGCASHTIYYSSKHPSHILDPNLGAGTLPLYL